MLEHMSGSDHSEVVAVINRSMPIIIRKKSVLKCEICNEEFKYNIEMKKHSKRTGHTLPYTASDDYQELHKCQACEAKFKSSVSLAAHLKSKHKQKAYFCLEERNLIRQGFPVKNLRKKCHYCSDNVVLKSVLELKEHIRTVHPDIRKRCPKCGMSFILFQEGHQCLFSTDSQAECYFHEVLHSEPHKEYRKRQDVEILVEKYPCPLCSKSFTKKSLRQHLRVHTLERPFACSTCGANFTTQSSLSNHCKNSHQPRISENFPNKIVVPVTNRSDDWKCTKCSKTFSNRSGCSRHRCDAGRRCPHDGCSFVASTPAHLTRHRIFHGEQIKNYECTLCPFKTNQASHMERHIRCHNNLKPYACPHCNFTCGSLENLRKHVLKSSRHQGMFLYQCPLCDFQCNTATDLRAHLTNDHPDHYTAKTAVQAVKMILMKGPV
ncbi:hypothetical protein ACJJTC_015626 [Scirpophaga incertulas]